MGVFFPMFFRIDQFLGPQVAVLCMAFGLDSAQLSGISSRHRPVALELQDHIRALGHDVEGPMWEGPFNVDAVTESASFCLMPEDAYFKRLPGKLSSPEMEEKMELCHERAWSLQHFSKGAKDGVTRFVIFLP